VVIYIYVSLLINRHNDILIYYVVKLQLICAFACSKFLQPFSSESFKKFGTRNAEGCACMYVCMYVCLRMKQA